MARAPPKRRTRPGAARLGIISEEAVGTSTSEELGSIQAVAQGGALVKRLFPTMAVLAFLCVAAPAIAETDGYQGFLVASAGPPGAPRTVDAFGTINSSGTEVVASSAPGRATVRWVFPEGTLFVTNTFTSTMELDSRACVRTITLQGTWTITNATGQFTGTTGEGTFSGPNEQLLNVTPEGECSTPPVFLAQVYQFAGDVYFAAQAAA